MTTITAEELKARLNAGEELNLVDVREPDEHAAFNIGGTFLPLGKIQTMQTDDIEELIMALKNNSIARFNLTSKPAMHQPFKWLFEKK